LSKEGIKEKIMDLRELLKGLILLEITLLSGIVINTYKILIKSIPFYMVFISFIGIVLSFQIALFIKSLLHKLEEYERKL